MSRTFASPVVRRSGPGRDVVGTLWPNREFSLGLRTTEIPSFGDSEGRDFHVEPLPERVECSQLGLCVPDEDFTLTYPRNSHTKPNRPSSYGKKGITSFGKKMVRSSCYILEREVGRSNVSFLTLTLPPMPRDEAVVIAKDWGVLCNRLTQWIKRALVRGGVRPFVIGVTELQKKRSERGDPGALHLHVAFPGRTGHNRPWVVSKEAVGRQWMRMLSSRVGRTVTSPLRPYLRGVKKTLEHYLGKYMSKGACSNSELVEQNGWDVIPGQWWFCSQDMRVTVRRRIRKGSAVGRAMESLISAYFNSEGDKFPGQLFPSWIEIDGCQVLMGYYGKLDEETTRELYAWMNALRDESTLDLD